jgi:hypothetical protein
MGWPSEKLSGVLYGPNCSANSAGGLKNGAIFFHADGVSAAPASSVGLDTKLSNTWMVLAKDREERPDECFFEFMHSDSQTFLCDRNA